MIWPFLFVVTLYTAAKYLKFSELSEVHTERKTLRSNYATKNFLMYSLQYQSLANTSFIKD